MLKSGSASGPRVLAGLLLIAVLGAYLFHVASKPENATEAMASGNYGEAARFYEAAIEQGDRRAANSLGNLYYLGLGVDKDYTLASQLYLTSASAGIAAAQLNLGHLFKQGLGVAIDPVRAFAWYNMADIHGNPIAEYYMRQITQEQTLTALQIKAAQTDWAKLPSLVDAGLE